MTMRTYIPVVATLLAIIALLHLLRIIAGWEVTVSGTVIPMWVSWLAVILAGLLSIAGWKSVSR